MSNQPKRTNFSSFLQQLNNDDDLNSNDFSAAFGIGPGPQTTVPVSTVPSVVPAGGVVGINNPNQPHSSVQFSAQAKSTLGQPSIQLETSAQVPTAGLAAPTQVKRVSQHREQPPVVPETVPVPVHNNPNLANLNNPGNPQRPVAEPTHSDAELQHLFAQIQIEQSSHELTRKKLDYFAEEKSLLMKEISTNRLQIDNLNKMKILMSQSLEQHLQNQTKMAQDLAKRQQNLEQEKLQLQNEIEREKTAELELSSENSKLKTKLDSLNESCSVLGNEKPFLSTTYENEKNIRIHLETENNQYRDRSNQLQKELDKERTENVALAKEVQDLKKQAKALESASNTTEELTNKIQIFEQILSEEQAKRTETEVRFVDLHIRYTDLFTQYTKQFQLIADTLSSIKQRLNSFPPEIQTRISAGHS